MKNLVAGIVAIALGFLVAPLQAQQQARFGEGDTFQEIMRNDHQAISLLVQQLRETEDAAGREDLFDRLKEGLDQHMTAEEEYLYPVLQKEAATQGAAIKAQDEHAAAKMQLGKIDPKEENQVFITRLDVLNTLINAHVEYEEKDLLELVDQYIPEEEQQKITDQFKKVYK